MHGGQPGSPVVAPGPDGPPSGGTPAPPGPGTSEPESAAAPEGASRAPFRLGNRPPLTGIRAVALVAVLTYHSNFRTMPGAWVALDIFFVLSGFLITAMLAREAGTTGRISLKRFYSRRAARLLPPLLLTVGLLGVYASLVHVADASRRVWGDSLAALFYYADYRQALGHAPFFGYLAQCWSLSVEEQFYLIWSVLMVAVVALGRRRMAYGIAVVGIASSVGVRLWLALGAAHFDHAVFGRIYYAFDTRADALFLGCLLGLLASDNRLTGWSRPARRAVAVASVLAAGTLVWAVLEVPLWTKPLVLWWLPASELAAAVVILHFVVNPTGLGPRAIGVGVLVLIGDMSYTVYLVHFPVYLALNPAGTHWSYWPLELTRLAVIFAIAVPSWFLIEKPLTRWRRRALAPGAEATPAPAVARLPATAEA